MAGKKKTNYVANGHEYFRTRLQIGIDIEGNKIFKTFYGKCKAEALSKKEEYIKLVDSGVNPDLNQVSLERAMYDWLWNIEKYNGNKSSTFERYECIFRKYVKDTNLGRTVLSRINKIAIQKYYNDYMFAGKTNSTISHINRLLNKFFRFAVNEAYIIRNPLNGLRLPRSNEEELEENKEVETFANEELKELFNSIGDRKLKYIAMFALFTGARKGEILALKKSDIENGIVKINKTVKRVKIFDSKKEAKYEVKVTKPKTPNSNREVPLPDYLIREMRTLNKLVIEERLKLGEEYTVNDLLFPSLTGNYIDESTLTKSWTRALKKAGIPHRKFHALRHTYATKLFENGASILTVSRLLGHGSIKTTEIYTHVLENIKREEVASLNSLLL